MLPAPVSGITECEEELEAIKKIKWSGVHDLASITKSFPLPILVRALESHYGNSDLNAFSRLDVLKIHNAVVVDLVLAKFERAGQTTKHEHDLTVDMVDDRPVQICFPKDFCGLFQLAHTIEKVKRYKSAKELSQHLPRLVKVVKCGQEFPSDISKGDIIQVIMEVDDGIKSYLSVKRNKVGAEPTEMSMKCKGVFESVLDSKSYNLSELLQLFTLPCKVNLPKKSKRALNVKSEVLSLLNHVGGTLTLQREVASEFFVATTTVQQSADQATVLVLSKNANVQFEIAEDPDRNSKDYKKILDSFGTVAIKGIPQELFISEHGMPFVACLNYRKHTQSTALVPADKPEKPPPPPPRPKDTFPNSQIDSPRSLTLESQPVDKTKTKLRRNLTSKKPFTGKQVESRDSPDDSDESHLYERISKNALRRPNRLERDVSPQRTATDNDYYAEIKLRTALLREIEQQHTAPSAKPKQLLTSPYGSHTSTAPYDRQSQMYTASSARHNHGNQMHTSTNERPNQMDTAPNQRHIQMYTAPKRRQGQVHITQSMSSGRQDIRPTAPSGRQDIRPTAPSGRQDIRQAAPSGRQDIRQTAPSGRQDIRQAAPSGRQDIRQAAPNGRQDIRQTVPSGRQDIRQTAPSGRQDIRPTVPSGRHDQHPTSNTSTTCDTLPNRGRVPPVPPILITPCQEEPYEYMNMTRMNNPVKYSNKKFLDPKHVPFSHSYNTPLLPMSGSYSRMIDQSRYHCNFQTRPSDSSMKQRLQGAPVPSSRDSYTRMDRAHFTSVSIFEKSQLQDGNYINGPNQQLPDMADMHSEEVMQLRNRKARSKSLDSILYPPSPPLTPTLPPLPPYLPPLPRNLPPLPSNLPPLPPNLPPRPSFHHDNPTFHPPDQSYPFTIPRQHTRSSNYMPSQYRNFADTPLSTATGYPYSTEIVAQQGVTPLYHNKDFSKGTGYVTMPRRQNPSGNFIRMPSATSLPSNDQRRIPPPVPCRTDVNQESQTLLHQSDDDIYTPEPSQYICGNDSDVQHTSTVKLRTSLSVEQDKSEQVVTNTSTRTVGKPLDFTRIRHIPPDIGQLSVSELAQCLHLIHVDDHVIDILHTQQVDGTLLTHMSEDMLRNDLGVSPFQAKKLYLFAHNSWRPTSACDN